ncbi:MAG: HAMP domain-containing sensor histidine kinase [Actinomycetota bacterium]
MSRLPLRWLLLWPSLAFLSVGAVALGVFVERSVQRDLVAFVDDELARALIGQGQLGAGTGTGEGPVGTGEGPVGGRGVPPGQGAPGTAEATVGGDGGGGQSGAVGPEAPLQFVIGSDGVVTRLSAVGDESPLTDELVAPLAGTSQRISLDTEPRYRVRSAPGPDGTTVVMALSLSQVDESLASLRRNLLVGGIVLFGLQALAIWSIAGLVARPVNRMGDVAHRIAGGELDADVVAPSGPRETADLAADLATMLDRLRSTIAERERSAATAHRARRDMERFLADASHELSTPLTALKGYSDLHAHGMLQGEDVDRAMARVGSESERLHRLVVELLHLVKDEHVAQEVDVGAVASAVVHDVRAAHPGRAIGLSVPTDPLVVVGDPHRLHQAVLNLVANACHHTPAEVAVDVIVAPSDDRAEIRVVDHGPGVDPEVADELFLPFTRGDASRSRRSHDGAGLGLALVRRIAEQHLGRASVGPTEGGGATFVLSLPVADGSVRAAEPQASVAKPVNNL